MSEIDEALGYLKPPVLEFIFVEPMKDMFGHACMRYTVPDDLEGYESAGPGRSRVINVTQGDGRAGEVELVEIWEEPADYLIGSYGVKGAGGLHARSMCSIRIQEWDHDAILALHFYINSIRAAARAGAAPRKARRMARRTRTRWLAWTCCT